MCPRCSRPRHERTGDRPDARHFGAGMLAGAMLTSRVVAVMPFGRAIQVGPVVSVLAALAMAATLVLPHAALAALSFALFGAGPMVWTIASTTLARA